MQAICLKTLQDGKLCFGQSETAQAARIGFDMGSKHQTDCRL
jgi:hypothetical protein